MAIKPEFKPESNCFVKRLFDCILIGSVLVVFWMCSSSRSKFQLNASYLARTFISEFSFFRIMLIGGHPVSYHNSTLRLSYLWNCLTWCLVVWFLTLLLWQYFSLVTLNYLLTAAFRMWRPSKYYIWSLSLFYSR